MELWFSEFHTPDVKHSLRVNRHLYSQKSNYQQIDIYDTPEFGKVLTLDGNVMLTERDEFIYDEMITHVPMAVHPNVQDVLVIGAGDGGVVKELARYESIRSIDLVEMDEQVVEACRRYLPENACRLDDQRVHIYFDNALRFIRRRHAQYDLIIVDSTDPFGPSEGYFTREFYGICYNALRDDGIMVNQQGSPFYRHDAEAMQRCHKRIVSTFPISRVYQAHIPTYAAGYWLFGFASKKYHPIDDPKWFRNRDFIGKKWSKKYIRAVQAVLTSTHGKIGRGKQFYEAAFGADEAEFHEIMMMPEALIIRRFENDQAKRERFGRIADYKNACDNITDEWRGAFNALSEGQRKIADPIILKNQFTDDDIAVDDLAVYNVLRFYQIQRPDK